MFGDGVMDLRAAVEEIIQLLNQTADLVETLTDAAVEDNRRINELTRRVQRLEQSPPVYGKDKE